jgi:hypothetical protein
VSTAAEKRLMAATAQLDCCICRRIGYYGTPAEVHHVRTGTGAGRRGADLVPLCPEHHRGNTGLHGMGRKAFERAYGVTELALAEETKARMKL